MQCSDVSDKLSDSVEIDLFMKLAQENNHEGLAVMLENNPELLNARDLDGNSCLHWASDRNSFEYLEKLLDYCDKLERNGQNKQGETALPQLAYKYQFF